MDENLLKTIRAYQDSLDKYTKNRNDLKLIHYMKKLSELPIKVTHLEETGVGKTVNALKKMGGDVGEYAKYLVFEWKRMVIHEQYANDESDSGDDEKDVEDQSSHDHGERSHSSKNDRHKDSSRKEKHKDKKDSGSSQKHKSEKRSIRPKNETEDEASSADEEYKSDLSGKRKNESDSEGEESVSAKRIKTNNQHKESKHKHDEKSRGKSQKSHSSKSSKSSEKKEKSTKEVSADEKHSKSHEKKSETKSKNSSSKKDKSKTEQSGSKSKEDVKNQKSKSSKKESRNQNGIDSGSGASFAEALGMCEPSSSKTSTKKKSQEDKNKEKNTKTNDCNVPKLLKDSNLEPVDINLSSLLPTITPNYRPLGNLLSNDHLQKRSISEFEELSNAITSKSQRTKVYSGNKTGCGKVPTLFEMCVRILQDNIDALEFTGGVPFLVLKPILEKANPDQLFTLEHHNPYLIDDTDYLWKMHCQREFRNKNREELETWREMYMRCLDEREAKLKALTANIKQSQDKCLPVRTTKLAYVDDVVKPPRNVARKQAKNGTGCEKKPLVTPSSRLSSLATAGEAGKIVVPNPVNRTVERNNTMLKVKKAPLMAKSLSLLKNRFRR